MCFLVLFFLWTYLFWESGECKRHIDGARLAEVDSVAPGAAAPLATRVRKSLLNNGHVSMRTAILGERHEFSHRESIKSNLKPDVNRHL